MTRILLFEDNVELCEGLSVLLKGVEDYRVSSYHELAGLDSIIRTQRPDIVLMDIGFPAGNGVDAARRIKNISRNIKVIMLTGMDDDQYVFDSLKAGADGYLLKKTPPIKLLEYLQEAREGGAPMTPSIARRVLESFSATKARISPEANLTTREKEVLKLLVSGLSYKMVAADMHVSIDTVRSHIRNIYEKLEVNSKSEAVAKAIINHMV